MKSITKKFFTIMLTLVITFGMYSLPAFAAESEPISPNASYVLIDSFNLNANVGSTQTVTYNASGYSSYQFRYTFVGVNGAVITFEYASPTGMIRTITAGGTIGSLSNGSITNSLSGTHTFTLQTWPTSPYGAVIHVSVYAK